jgi:hypothetical protein
MLQTQTPGLRTDNFTAGNMALLQAGLTQELQPLLLSITFVAWRQVVASKPQLQQAVKRYAQCNDNSATL